MQSLVRIRYFVFCDYIADRFEQDDGCVVLVSLLSHQGILSDPGMIVRFGRKLYRTFLTHVNFLMAAVMAEFLETITHLLKFEETKTALLLVRN